MARFPLRETIRLCRTDTARYTWMLRQDGVNEGHSLPGVAEVIRAAVLCQGLQASLVYRLGHAVATWEPGTEAGRTVRRLARILHFGLARIVEMTSGIRINEHALIGPGLHIAHHGTTIIGAVRMGANCNLTHSITLGRSSRRGDRSTPTLGDRVWIGPGAVVTGGIGIGDDAVIGANAVVTRSLPERAVALGVPARIHSYQGSFSQVDYPGADTDLARAASAAKASEGSTGAPPGVTGDRT